MFVVFLEILRNFRTFCEFLGHFVTKGKFDLPNFWDRNPSGGAVCTAGYATEAERLQHIADKEAEMALQALISPISTYILLMNLLFLWT